jgi:hypothetical protein
VTSREGGCRAARGWSLGSAADRSRAGPPVTTGNRRHRPTTGTDSGRDASSGASAQAGTTRTDPSPGGGGTWRSQRPDQACLVTSPPGTGSNPSRRSKRQEGTDRGDAERLSTRTSSEGVNSVAGTGPTTHGAIRGPIIRETRRTSNRQRGATNPRRSGGASRQGSAKLRRRNGSRRVAPSARRSREAPGVDVEAHVGRDDPMIEPTRGGFASPARRESSEGEIKRRRPRRADPATDLGRGVSREDLGGAAGNGGTPGGSGEANEPLPRCDDTNGLRCAPSLESQVNLMRATAKADSNRCSTL